MTKAIKAIFIIVLIFLSVNSVVALFNTTREGVRRLPFYRTIFFLAERVESLENRVESLEGTLENQKQVIEGTLEKGVTLEEELEGQKQTVAKQEACRKVNELNTAPAETKVYSYYEGQPRYASWAPDTTKELLDYMKAYWEHYQATGDYYYQHNPDYFPEMVEKHLPVLELRYQEYLKYKELCGE